MASIVRDKRKPALDAQSIIKDVSREMADPLRRALGKRILTQGGLALLSGCSLTDERSVDAMLRNISRFNDRVQGWLFDPRRLAPTYFEAMVTRPFPFNAFYDIDDVPQIDGATYKLEVRGLISGKTQWTLAELGTLPQNESDHASHLH
ncbi:DMSO/TMAO reductase YedYZ molybdopterin-dependent catalytic subunit [Paraburkholderia sp. CI3]